MVQYRQLIDIGIQSHPGNADNKIRTSRRRTYIETRTIDYAQQHVQGTLVSTTLDCPLVIGNAIQ